MQRMSGRSRAIRRERHRSRAAGCSPPGRNRSTRHGSVHPGEVANFFHPMPAPRTRIEIGHDAEGTRTALLNPSRTALPLTILGMAAIGIEEKSIFGRSVFFSRSAARQSTKKALLYFRLGLSVKLSLRDLRSHFGAGGPGSPSAPYRHTRGCPPQGQRVRHRRQR